jgi:hypothetical protein
VDSVPDPLLFSGSAGNRIRASRSVAKNSGYWTTEAVIEELLEMKNNGSGLENRDYGLRDPSS